MEGVEAVEPEVLVIEWRDHAGGTTGISPRTAIAVNMRPLIVISEFLP
jgi:hypothetical protein